MEGPVAYGTLTLKQFILAIEEALETEDDRGRTSAMRGLAAKVPQVLGAKHPRCTDVERLLRNDDAGRALVILREIESSQAA